MTSLLLIGVRLILGEIAALLMPNRGSQKGLQGILCCKFILLEQTMPKHALDRTDLSILRELQHDARISNVELAKRVNLSPSPCLARVRVLEKRGVINRYVALVNPLEVGLGLSVFIQISLERQVERTLEQFEAAVKRFPEIVECYMMTGDSDYLLRVVVPDVLALEGFILNGLSKLSEVANIRSSFAIKQVKYDTALPLPAASQDGRLRGSRVGRKRPESTKRRVGGARQAS
jgi:Lrp/AsnC family transcriptional regulator, leucine-responsive regulatory protein